MIYYIRKIKNKIDAIMGESRLFFVPFVPPEIEKKSVW